jgi:hypothetical protein
VPRSHKFLFWFPIPLECPPTQVIALPIQLPDDPTPELDWFEGGIRTRVVHRELFLKSLFDPAYKWSARTFESGLR